MTDLMWIQPNSTINLKYAVAPPCPHCRGNIKYVLDRGVYYTGGHIEGCPYLGMLPEYTTEKEMIEDWEIGRTLNARSN